MQNESTNILFEKFEVLEVLKKDDHAGVYLANHMYLGKKIILKALNVNTIADDSIVERFKREAKILARLEHPNIIRVLDFGTYQEFFYISFEYFDSRNLRQIIIENDLSDDQKKKLTLQLLKGLGFAHQNQIIHRDIKPENILVNETHDLKIGDFGLAVSAQENYVTRQYSIVGTPSYMSPEQIKGDVLTSQTDLFSLGIVILELYSGSNPFLGKDINESLNNISNIDKLALEKYLNEIPHEICSMLKMLLIKELSKRLKNINEAMVLLGEKDEQIAVANLTKRKNSKKTAMLVMAFIAVTASIIYVAAYLSNSNPQNETETALKNKGNSSEHSLNENITEEKRPELKNNESDPELPEEKLIAKLDEGTARGSTEVLFGDLFIECFPWADVYIDGNKFETTPIKDLISLPAGIHTIKLAHPEFPVYEQQINITVNETANIRVNLDTLLGYIDCKVFPWGQIYLDGIYKGDTPFSDALKLFPGEHQIKVVNPDYGTYEERIVISKYDTLRFYYRFEK